MIYLDNAATSFPKPKEVLKKIDFCLKKCGGNPGRSSHRLSLLASEEVYSTREKVANHFGSSSPECVVFTYNATYALNLAIKTLVKENCHVLTSDYEHNSVIRPLEKLRETKAVSYTSFDTNGDVRQNILDNLTPKTKGIVCSLRSNVLSSSLSLKVVSEIAKDNNLFLIVDASQSAGHDIINLSETPCDVFCAPGHKGLFGIAGVGFAIFKDNIRKESFIEGGSGSESESPHMPNLLPEGYEAGTLSTPAIASLGAGIDFIDRVGIDNITKKLSDLSNKTYDALSKIAGVKVYDFNDSILSFNYKDYPSSFIASLLDNNRICARGGLHCAPLAHIKNGTVRQGSVRVSFSYFNKENDCFSLYKALKEISKVY